MATHYHVGENTPGYLPEVDPSTYESLPEAIDGANFVIDELEGMGYKAGARFETADFTNPDGLAGTITGLSISLEGEGEYDLGRVVFVHTCDSDCDET